MTRLDANRRILQKLEKAVERFPDWRFHQILQNCGAESSSRDNFFDESSDILASMEANPTMSAAEAMKE